MHMKKLISLILAVALLLSCAPQILPVAEAVEIATPTVVYTVGDLGVEGAVIADTIEAVFAAISANNKQWAADAVVEIQFKGDVSGGAQNGLLFGQTTIWRKDGTKLPITLRGVDTKFSQDAYIYLDSAGGWYACANDYTFTNLTLPIGDAAIDFYAGCGNIVFDNIVFKKQNPGITSVADQTGMYEFAKRTALAICADENNEIIPEVSRVPAGDAWQMARQIDSFIGEGLCGKEGTYYGDGGHDGDTGGGQYLNACVYFEVMTGLSCLGNTWRPTAYTLDEEMIEFLQNVAHDTVTAVYGEDHYVDSWTDVAGDDNVFNILWLGSSNCAYQRDEMYYIAKAAGIEARVVHGYYSGVRIATQWSWVENDNGKYEVVTFDNRETETRVKDQKITDFLDDYAWDSIVVYQTAGAFDDFEYTEEGYAKCFALCEKADEFYNYIYNYNDSMHAGANYYWYQTVASPVGAKDNTGTYYGRIFADNCTRAVYTGWNELKEGQKVQTSITFGDNTFYRCLNDWKVAAVGYQQEAPAVAYTDATAAQVTYPMLAGYANAADIRPVDIEASIIIDGDYIQLSNVRAKLGYAPSAGRVVFKKGYVDVLYLAQTPTGGNAEIPFYGDITMEYYKEADLDNWRGVYADITGDVTMVFDGFEWTTNMITVNAGSTVDGDLTVDVRDGSIGVPDDENTTRLYVAGNGHSDISTVTGTATFRWGGGYIDGIYTGRNGKVGNLVNEFYCNPNAEIPADTGRKFALAGESTCVVDGTIYNNFIGAVPENVLKKISHFGGGDGNHTKIVNTVKADAQGKAPTFDSFCGGITSGTVTEIVNNIEAGTFTTFNGGSKKTTGTTKITNNISGGTFSADTTWGGMDAADVSTVITAGTFSFDPTQFVPATSKVQQNGGTYVVTPKVVQALNISKMPVKTIYQVGESLDTTGLVLGAVNAAGAVSLVEEGYTVSGFTSGAVGKKTVTVSYEDATVTFCVAVVDDSIPAVDDFGNVYETISDAVRDCAADSKLILLQNLNDDVTVGRDLCIDLNGYSITGTVTVDEDYTLYGTDSKTDDYNIDDGEGYGKLTNVVGNVAGLPEASALAEDGYLMVKEDGGVSFHRVNLQLTAMTLRAESAGVYFKSAFGGDRLVAENVAAFGVALSLSDVPNKENLGVTSLCSRFDGQKFSAGLNNGETTSTLLYGIMKTTNGRLTNTANAMRPVCGRAYVQLKNGDYLFGGAAYRSFQKQVEMVDAKWDALNEEQQTPILEMYSQFVRVMRAWEIPAIKNAAK